MFFCSFPIKTLGVKLLLSSTDLYMDQLLSCKVPFFSLRNLGTTKNKEYISVVQYIWLAGLGYAYCNWDRISDNDSSQIRYRISTIIQPIAFH